MKRHSILWGFALLATWASVSSGDMTIRDLVDNPTNRPLYDRMLNSPDFIAADFDLSGVGNRNAAGTGEWATMISESYFITAHHARPADGASLVFHHTNDPNGPRTTREVASTVRIGNTDLSIGRLTSAIDPSLVAIYPIAIGPELASFLGKEIYVYGRPHRVGMNSIDQILQLDATPVGDIAGMVFDFDTPTGGVGPAEARVESGDSGAPSFVAIQNQLALLSIHSLKYTSSIFPGLAPTGSIDSFVPPYITEINAVLAQGGESLRFLVVPEPASFALVAVGLPGLWLVAAHRRRRLARAA